MKKNIVTIGLFTLLVIFPLISWYYLRTGIDYRKRLLEETNPIGSISEFVSCNIQNNTDKATLYNYYNSESESFIEFLNQFKDDNRFRIVDLDADCIITKGIVSKDVKMMLVDTSLNVRSVYYNYQDSTLRKLSEHLTLVIPGEVEKDIKIK